MRYVACPAGTSVARDVPPLHEDHDPNRFKRAIVQRCRDLKKNKPDQFRQLVSAEVNSLARLGISKSDNILLLHSDTDDGHICAEQVQAILEEGFACTVQMTKVEGLQTTDPRAFRRKGVPALFRCLDQYAEALCGGDEFILNATGGFKAMVPYLTLYAMLKRHRVIYLFESSPSLIDLPPAPLSFDWDRLARVTDVLIRVRDEEIIDGPTFNRLIEHVPYEDKEWAECLWDRTDDLIHLSAFGQIVATAMSAEEGADVYLSPAASDALNESEGAAREQYLFMLSRVSNPLMRAQHMHSVDGSDLLIWKPGSTAERMEYFLENGKIYVCALHQHRYTGTRRRDYDLNTFVQYRPPPPPARTQRELEETWTARVEAAEKERAAADALVAEAAQQLESVKGRLAEANRLSAAARSDAERAERALDEAKATIQRLQWELTQARLPWWRRLFRRA